MARLDVHPMPTASSGYVVDVQADLRWQLSTSVVVPLLLEEGSVAATGEVNPVFEVGGARPVFAAPAIASVPDRESGGVIGSLAAVRDAITRELDVLLLGF